MNNQNREAHRIFCKDYNKLNNTEKEQIDSILNIKYMDGLI